MSEYFNSNEPLTFKNRFEQAFKNIALLAENDFTPDCSYKIANKKSHALIKSLEFSPENSKLREVRDVIPESNLVKYGKFLYNESRERSYSDGGRDIAIHCFRKTFGVEPWMWPEVEQMFLHTVFSNSYNFKLYESEMGDDGVLEIDAIQEENVNNGDDLLEHLFDQAPERLSAKDREAIEAIAQRYYFKTNNCNEKSAKETILSDDVRKIWTMQKSENQTMVLKVYKSSLDNLFVEEGQSRYVNNLNTDDANRSLEKLVKSISDLNENLPNIEEPEETVEEVVEETTPVKRLYSQVVQGKSSVQETRRVSTSPKTTPSEILKPPPMPDYEEKFEENLKPLFATSESLQSSPQTLKSSISDSQSFSSCSNSINASPEAAPGFERSSASYQNFYNLMQCAQNKLTVNNNRMDYPYAGQVRPNPNIVYQPQQQPQQQIPWLLPYRPQNFCNNYGNFLGQLLLPPVPINKPRWNSPRQPPNWHNQYHPNKPRNIPKYPTTRPPETAKPKIYKKPIPQTNIHTNPNYYSKSCPDYKLMMRNEGEGSASTSLRNFEAGFESSFPVTSTASEELETIALREYQSSNDIFSEIERQAKEQYDDNPENLCCPPNKRLSLGGLSFTVHLFQYTRILQ